MRKWIIALSLLVTGLAHGKITPCGARPNCVSSLNEGGSARFVQALPLAYEVLETKNQIKKRRSIIGVKGRNHHSSKKRKGDRQGATSVTNSYRGSAKSC